MICLLAAALSERFNSALTKPRTLSFDAGFSLDSIGSLNSLTNTSGNITVATGVTPTINAKLAGSNGLTLIGSGTLELTGMNTYSGSTTIYNGELDLNGAIVESFPPDIGANGTVKINAAPAFLRMRRCRSAPLPERLSSTL